MPAVGGMTWCLACKQLRSNVRKGRCPSCRASEPKDEPALPPPPPIGQAYRAVVRYKLKIRQLMRKQLGEPSDAIHEWERELL